jgi:hypothetical protein
MTAPKIKWLAAPEKHDYPAARSYLNLLFPDKRAKRLAAALKKAPVAQFKAKDIFRASGLSLLGVSNSHVARDQKQIRAGGRLSPLLLVRDRDHGRVIIATTASARCIRSTRTR